VTLMSRVEKTFMVLGSGLRRRVSRWQTLWPGQAPGAIDSALRPMQGD
jgi:hypothetical protein